MSNTRTEDQGIEELLSNLFTLTEIYLRGFSSIRKEIHEIKAENADNPQQAAHLIKKKIEDVKPYMDNIEENIQGKISLLSSIELHGTGEQQYEFKRLVNDFEEAKPQVKTYFENKMKEISVTPKITTTLNTVGVFKTDDAPKPNLENNIALTNINNHRYG